MTKVVIYSKPGCHLCDEAKAAILAAGCEGQFTLEEVNIETDSDLSRRYRYEIPVVTFDGVETFRQRVSSEEFREALRQLKRTTCGADQNRIAHANAAKCVRPR